MAIKNFLFLRGVVSVLVISSVGCGGIQTRHQLEESGALQKVSVEPGQPTPVVQTPANEQAVSGLPQVPAPAPTPGITGKALPVGVYLGPGAMRAFAHIGVLRAFQKAQIPIVAIGGMEWGSIVAASYATSRGANEVEWEMMKLRKEDLPSTSLLSREVTAKDTESLFGFLKTSFGDKDLATGTIPFRCPTTDGAETVFVSQGKAREQLLRCAVLPPMYRLYDRAGKQWMSGAVSPGDWPGELRKLGAQYIIYIDVISRGSFMAANKYPNEQQLKALWMAVKGISKEQHLFANMTIEIPLDYDLTDFDHRRDAMATGEQIANSKTNDILHAIGVQ